MSWRLAARADMDAVREYLLRDETFCVPFTARLREGGRGNMVYLSRDAQGCVTGSILLTSSGLLLPLMDDDPPPGSELARLLRDAHPAVHSVMGTGRSVQAIESVMPVVSTARIEYFLMSVSRDGSRPALPSEDHRLRVRLADEWDADAIFPLQKAYELEEVVVDPRHFNDAQCMKLLRRTLKDELVFVAERDRVPVAKAATNARGFTVDQIGGVYTVPGSRNAGIAARGVRASPQDLPGEGKRVPVREKEKPPRDLPVRETGLCPRHGLHNQLLRHLGAEGAPVLESRRHYGI